MDVETPDPADAWWFDPRHYREIAGMAGFFDVPDEPKGALAHWLSQGKAARLVPLADFDEAFYQDRYADVRGSGLFGFTHFIQHGLAEGRAPNSWFKAVAARNHEVPPFSDYVRHGRPAGQAPQALQDSMSLGEYDQLLAAARALGRTQPVPHLQLLLAMLLPAAYDGAGELDRTASRWKREAHFLEIGLKRGDPIGPLFDRDFYRRQALRAGLPKGADLAPLLHFAHHGVAARVVPTPMFDADWYLRQDPGLAETGQWGFAHYLMHGVAEDRKPGGGTYGRLMLGGAPGSRGQLRLMLEAGVAPLDGAAEQGELFGLLRDTGRTMTKRLHSPLLADLVARARTHEPAIMAPADVDPTIIAPFNDPLWRGARTVQAKLGKDHYEFVACIGASAAATALAGRVLSAIRRLQPGADILWLSTEAGAELVDPGFERLEFAGELGPSQTEMLLCATLRRRAARHVLSIGSDLGWRTLRRFGPRLADLRQLHLCLPATRSGSCASREATTDPAWQYGATAAIFTSVLVQDASLCRTLLHRYQPPAALARRLHLLPAADDDLATMLQDVFSPAYPGNCA